MENTLFDRQVYGFKFESNEVRFADDMNKYIGEVGIITRTDERCACVRFSDGVEWWYPLRLIEDYLVEKPSVGQYEIY
jgi:hypothetical protein